MSECKECGDYMNPVQVILSSTHGVCGKCTRKKHRLVINGKEIDRREK